MNLKIFQDGGMMPPAPEQPQEPMGPEAPAQEPMPAQDPIGQLLQLSQQALQGNDCAAAMEVVKGFVQLVAEVAPQGQPAPTPTYQAKGGKLVRIK